MNVDIMIASWKDDLPYVEYCLKSIAKFATGFDKVVLVVANDEERLFRKFQDQAVLKMYDRVSDPVLWHLQSQAIKCQADLFCDGDYILHTDSDCVFIEPVKPEDYFTGGKPDMVIENYARLPATPWKSETERALGFPVKWETMRRHPQVNHRRMYGDFRALIELVHGVPFESYVLAQKPTFPWGFSEFNAMGNFALNDMFWQKQYHWIKVGEDAVPKPKLFQAWSLGPIDRPQPFPNGGNGVPLEYFKSLGL